MAVPALVANSPATGDISWGAFNIQYRGTAWPIPAGNTGYKYTAWLWNNGTPVLAYTDLALIPSAQANGDPTNWTTVSPIVGPDDLVLFVNQSGVPIDVQKAQLVDGDMVVSGTITSQNIATGTIVAANIMGGTITGSLIAANTIQAGNISANAIGTNQLAANAVTAAQIAAGAITAEKLTIGTMGDNLVGNPGFQDAASGNPTMPALWTYSYESPPGGAGTQTWGQVNGNYTVTIQNSTTTGGAWASKAFPVTPGQTLAVQANVQSSSTGGANVYVRVMYGTASTMSRSTALSVNTPPIPTSVAATDLTNNNNDAGAHGGNGVAMADIVTSWQPATTHNYRVSGQTVVPADATWAQIVLYNFTATTGAATVTFDNVLVMPVIVSARIANGAITATQIAASTITASQIAAGAITTNQIAAGAITANQIAAGTITGGLLNANAINGMTITGATIIAGTTGAHITMGGATPNQINLYSGGGSEAQGGMLAVYQNASDYQISLFPPLWSGGNLPRIDLHSVNNGTGTLYANAIMTFDGPITCTSTLAVTGNITANAALIANSGLTINNGGLAVTGGIQVNSSLSLNNNTMYARAGNDPNHYFAYYATLDGPIIAGYKGVEAYIASQGGSCYLRFSQPTGTANQQYPMVNAVGYNCGIGFTNTLGAVNSAFTAYVAIAASAFNVGSSVLGKEAVREFDREWALDVIRKAPAKRWKYHNVSSDILEHEDGHIEHHNHSEPKVGPNGELLSASGDDSWHFGPVWEEMHEEVRNQDMKLDLRDLIGVLWGAVHHLGDEVAALKGAGDDTARPGSG